MEFIRPLICTPITRYRVAPLVYKGTLGLGVQSWRLEFQSSSRSKHFNSGILYAEFLSRRTLNFQKGGIQVEATSQTQAHTPKARFENTNIWFVKIIPHINPKMELGLGVQSWRLEFQSTSGWNNFNSEYLSAEFLNTGTLEIWKRGDPGRGHLTYPGPYTQGRVRNHNDLIE